MAFQKLDDIEIDGVKITNIYRECEYYFRTSGYNYEFYFHSSLLTNSTHLTLSGQSAIKKMKNLTLGTCLSTIEKKIFSNGAL